MDGQILVAFVLAFITVVNGACQQAELQKCMEQISGSTDVNDQCKKDLPALKTCLVPHRESCKDDPMLAMVTGMETKMDALCAQFSGEGPNCALMSCSQMTPYITGLPEGQMPEATPEFCAAVGQFQTCFEAQKAKGNCDANMLNSYTQMLNGYNLMCGGCNAQKMMTCMQQIQSLVTQDFEGYPTSQQINDACPKMNNFKTCIQPVQQACAKVDSPQGKKSAGAINAAVQMVDLICGGDFKDDFLKYGKECFDKPAFKNVSKICKMMEAPVSEDSTPKQESQTEMCSRIRKEFECYEDNVGKACGDATVDFVKQVQNSFHNIIAEPLSCPIAGSDFSVDVTTTQKSSKGSSQLMSQLWLLVAVLMAGIFLF